ncbi:disulfide bond formation protein B [Citrobacter braakii]|nr:disulfide bond formation protein B [Citrobacter braakii]
MKTRHHTVTLAHLINMAGLIGICASLILAFYYQIAMLELPCPLCLLQRVGLIIAGFGFLFNILLGIRNSHYGMVILGSILTGIIASRQMFLHIIPGDSGYGSAFLGFHFYTWALITAILIVTAVSVIITISEIGVVMRPLNINPVFLRITGWIFILLISANLISTLLECGGGQCADNPVTYELLSK